jgi:Domain of Unknown Function with PDB structure (DUF3862)
MERSPKWLILLLCFAALVLFFLFSDLNSRSKPGPQNTSQLPPTKVTLANYEKIEDGMSFESVVEILGPHWNKKQSKGSGQEYIWKIGAAKHATITFENNRVVAKRSLGLN